MMKKSDHSTASADGKSAKARETVVGKTSGVAETTRAGNGALLRRHLQAITDATRKVRTLTVELHASIERGSYLDSGRLSFDIRAQLRRGERERDAGNAIKHADGHESLDSEFVIASRELDAASVEAAALLRIAPLIEASDAAAPEREEQWKATLPQFAGSNREGREEAFEGYRHGSGYTSSIVRVEAVDGGTARMNPEVHAQFVRMRAAALEDGITLEIRSGARSNEEQAVLRSGWEARRDSTIRNANFKPFEKDDSHLPPELNKQLRAMFNRDNMYLMAEALGHKADLPFRRFNRAAEPGRSNHQDPLGAQAVDIANASEASSRTYQWLQAHASEYGFVRTVRGENWHWEYRPGTSGLEHEKSHRK